MAGEGDLATGGGGGVASSSSPSSGDEVAWRLLGLSLSGVVDAGRLGSEESMAEVHDEASAVEKVREQRAVAPIPAATTIGGVRVM